MNNRTTILVVYGLSFAAPQLADAAESEDLHPWLESGFSLDLGIFYPDRELDLQVNGTLTGINDEIDLTSVVSSSQLTRFLRVKCPGDFAASGPS